MRRIIESAVVVLVLVACDSDFTKGWLVDRTRVLGLRIEAAADPTRATVSPGEKLVARWLVGAPNGTPSLAWSFALCDSPTGNFPEPRCERDPLVVGSGASNRQSVTTMEVDVPASVDRDAGAILLAAFCEGGPVASFDPRSFNATCAGGTAPLLASGSVSMVAPNKNPTLAADVVTLDGAPLTPTDLPLGEACSVAPRVDASSKHEIGFRFQDREPGESMIVSHVATKGELDRQYSSVDLGEPLPKVVTVPWTAAALDDAEIYFALRDGRGGAALARYVICLRRP